MTYCVINCTTANKEDAKEIAKHLVEKKLIACCNIIPSITSVYKWKNELCCDEECLMVMKTKTSLFKEIETEIKKIHKYDIPEIICLPITNGSGEYLSWINEQVLGK